jgi:hypothetical protein
MRFDLQSRVKNPNCNACSLPILRSAEVEYNGKQFHPGCLTALSKESHANLRQTTQSQQR